ncbi:MULTISPECIES: helix-turn-helix domain-containing protein [unclassified Phenylobacterium]|uniref:helix-turn-helix domain-containing protein n=1 Tax=unclassified Phenylobacterium TaxID=2640670 RepID=UPI00083B1A74|nr:MULTISPECIES: helix-turn-helix transcriptional regulator [unclassified Phenylobacterium]
MTNDDITRQIGRRLAERRRDLNLSLADVAERCGVSLQQIHKYERGQSTISAPMLYRLSRCLGVPVGYFFQDLEALARAEA